MGNKQLKLSIRMAFVIGLFLPVAETIRRIHQVMEFKEVFEWLDDYILGLVFIAAAFRALKQKAGSVFYLIATWGIGTGGLTLSFIGQFRYYSVATGDPGIFSVTLVLIVKALLLMYMLSGLKLSIEAAKSIYK